MTRGTSRESWHRSVRLRQRLTPPVHWRADEDRCRAIAAAHRLAFTTRLRPEATGKVRALGGQGVERHVLRNARMRDADGPCLRKRRLERHHGGALAPIRSLNPEHIEDVDRLTITGRAVVAAVIGAYRLRRRRDRPRARLPLGSFSKVCSQTAHTFQLRRTRRSV